MSHVQEWWNAERVHTAISVLRKYPRYCTNALTEIGDRLGRQVSYDGLQKALAKAGLGPPGSFCTPVVKPEAYEDAPPPVDPVAAHIRREEASRDKKTIAELVARLREAEARQAFLDAVATDKEPPRVERREHSSGLREMTAVVLASDWHVEELVEGASIAFRNAYNLDIAAHRIDRFFDAIIWNIEHHRASGRLAIRDLVLWLGGDLITGYIHDELVESNQLSPTEAVMWLVPKLRNGIATLLDVLKLESITLPCSPGNHGRTTEKRRISTGYKNSFEWLLYNWLWSDFGLDNRVRFEVTRSAHQYVDVYGRTLHFHHGDEVKYGGGVGGISVPLLKAIPAWDLVRRAYVHNIGHFHQLTDLGRAVVNGSLIGYGTFSQSIRASFEPPQQAMYFMDSKRGKCLTTALWVDEEEVAA